MVMTTITMMMMTMITMLTTMRTLQRWLIFLNSNPRSKKVLRNRPEGKKQDVTVAVSLRSPQGMDGEQWVVDFVRSGGFAQCCEAILTRGLFGDRRPEEMVDVQQACLVRILSDHYPYHQRRRKMRTA